MTASSEFKPAEPIMLSTPIGLNSLGAAFNIDAPFSACRICGTIYQSKFDRLCRTYLEEGRLVENYNPLTRHSSFTGDLVATNTLEIATERRARWRRLHERRYHTVKEIAVLQSTGFAFTPEAANKLAPYGITPLGNMHEEIVNALFEAPRAPYVDVEGGE